MRSKSVLTFQIKQNLCTIRTQLLFILISIFIYATIRPVNDFAAAYHIGVRPWAFPVLTNDYVCQLVIMAGAVILFSNAPFDSEIRLYLLPRTGNQAWALGCCLYIAVMSLLYVALLNLISLIAVLPKIELGADWGIAWNSLGGGGYAREFSLALRTHPYLIGAYSPQEALILSNLLEWLCCMFLGLVSLVLSSITNSNLGTLASAGFVMMDISVANEWAQWCYHISPVTMAQLSCLGNRRSVYGIDRGYAFRFFTVTILALAVFHVWSQNTKMIRRG